MAGAPRAALFGVFRRSAEQVSKMLSLRGFGGNKLLLRSLLKKTITFSTAIAKAMGSCNGSSGG